MAYSHTVDWNEVIDFRFAMKSAVTYSTVWSVGLLTLLECNAKAPVLRICMGAGQR